MATKHVKLEQLQGAAPASTTVLKRAPGSLPVMVGRGSVAFVCPTCGTEQCKGVAARDLSHIAFLCDCGTLGRVASP